MTILEMATTSKKRIVSGLKKISHPLEGIWPRANGQAVLGLFALAVVAFAALTYVTPVARMSSKLVTGNRYLAVAEGLINPFRSPRVLMNSGLPVYDLQVSHTEMANIDRAIEEAKKQGYMDEEQQVWANGRFIYDGQNYDVEVRVRGDLPPHWEGAKKSWRIKFRDEMVEYKGETTEEDIYFQGKRQINLIIPWDRDYVVAPFVNELMREAGLVVPEDRFVVLRLNGVVQGLYYEVEHFDKPLLAAHERPETPVTGQNDRAMHFEQYTKYGTAVVSDSWYDIGTISLQVEEEGEIAMQAMQAMQVLIDHARNPTPANFQRARAILDWEKYLRFRNITTLFNTNHVRFGSDNFKLYFDPSRGLFEPIPWDVHLVRMPEEPGTIDFWNSKGPDEIQRSTLMDPELRLQRNRMLWEWVSDGGERLLAQYNALHEEIRPLAWADVLSTPVHGYRMDVLQKDLTYNVNRVYKVLSVSNANFTYRLEANDRASLEAVALNFSGIQLREIQLSDPAVFSGSYQLYEDVNENGELDPQDTLIAETTASNGAIRFVLDKHVLPDVYYGGDTIDGRYWEYMDTLAGRTRFFLTGKLALPDRHPLEWTRPDIRVRAVNAVTGQDMPSGFIVSGARLPENYIGITAYDASDVLDLTAPELSLAEFLEQHPQFTASEEHPGGAELSGNVVISGTVIIPKTVPLILQPGTDITMMPNASILSYGGLIAVGTEEQRIRIHGNNAGEAWGSLAVIRPPQEVVMQYIDVTGGGQAQVNGILLTGGVAVHDGDLRLENCNISDMYSEDGLNHKNGQVYIANCSFARNASDSVDIDFGTGKVLDSVFIDNANDGLDISGSTITAMNNHFENNGDKGFSVGEDSHLTLVNALFRGNQIGLSTKDLSHAQVAYATFVDNVLAVEAKRKKPFFGGGSGEFVNSVFAGNQLLLDDDYFSQGQVFIHHSLVDDPAGCPTCQMANIRFQSTATGDYRLLAETVEDLEFESFPLEWEGLENDGAWPQLPGYYFAMVNR